MTEKIQADSFLPAGQFSNCRALLAAYGASCFERRLGCVAKNGRDRAEAEPRSLIHGVVGVGAIFSGVLVFH